MRQSNVNVELIPCVAWPCAAHFWLGNNNPTVGMDLRPCEVCCEPFTKFDLQSAAACVATPRRALLTTLTFEYSLQLSVDNRAAVPLAET